MQISKSFFIAAIVPQKLINGKSWRFFMKYLEKVLAVKPYQVSVYANSLQVCFQQKQFLPLQIHLLLFFQAGVLVALKHRKIFLRAQQIHY